MRKLLGKKDLRVLAVLADYEILTVSQLATLLFPSRQMARRKIRVLHRRDLVEMRSPGLGSTLGRPESLIALTPDGYRLLRSSDEPGSRQLPRRPVAVHAHDTSHQISINWIRIHLDHMGDQLQGLSTHFASPSLQSDVYRFAVDPPKPFAGIIPDGIFSVTHAESNKSLLFFLEVDMGTETLSSRSTRTRDIRGKILSYQEIFRSLRYKQLEDHFELSFRGFRTLFVAHQESRLQQLCRLVKLVPSTGFVWLTSLEDVLNRGMSASIWTAGGLTNSEPRSILGPSMATDCPLIIPK